MFNYISITTYLKDRKDQSHEQSRLAVQFACSMRRLCDAITLLFIVAKRYGKVFILSKLHLLNWRHIML